MLDWLFETAIIGALLAAVVWLVCRAVRLSPALRHTLWLVVLLKLLTPAGVAWQVPENWIVWQDMAITSAAVRYPAEPVSSETSPVELPEDISEEAIIEEMLAAAAAVKSSAEPIVGSPSDTTEDKVAVADSPVVGLVPTWREHVAEPPWRTGLLAVWSIGTLLVVLRQLQQLVRWRRLIRSSELAPEHLINHVRILAGHLRMRAPEVRVIEGLSSPVIWCLGRPRLLWPARLVDVDVVSNHAGVIVHELAHVKRRDHWVARLELLATSIWWWNPVWWAARGRLRETADLACDAWVVWTLPEDRRTYAESLIELSSVSRKKQSAVAFTLGATDNVCRDFERRLTMIVKSNWPRRVSVLNLTLIALLAFVVLPQWMMAEGPDDPAAVDPPAASTASVKPKPIDAEPALTDGELEPVASEQIATPEPELESTAVEPASEDLLQTGPIDPPPAISPPKPADPPAVANSTLPYGGAPSPGFGPPGAGYSQSAGGYGQPVPSPYQGNSYQANPPQAANVYPTTIYASAVPTPGSLKTVLRVFQLKHRKPAEMLPLIKPFVGNLQQATYLPPSLLPGQKIVGGTTVGPEFIASPFDVALNEASQIGGAHAGIEFSAANPVLKIDKLRVLADSDSKSLIARGPAMLVELVESVVKAMDVPEGAPIGKIEHPHMRAFNLRTRDAKQILMIADKLGLHPGIIYPSPQIGLDPSKPNQATSNREIPHLPSGVKTLIVAGNKEVLEDIARLIEALDPPADAKREAEIDVFLDELATPDRPAKSEPIPKY